MENNKLNLRGTVTGRISSGDENIGNAAKGEETPIFVSMDFSAVETKVNSLFFEKAKKIRRTIWATHNLSDIKLRKSRARTMLDAKKDNFAIRGNVAVVFDDFNTPTFSFWYRGTKVARWDVLTNNFEHVDCGEFERTASTRNQRKMAREAVEEFDKAVFGQWGY